MRNAGSKRGVVDCEDGDDMMGWNFCLVLNLLQVKDEPFQTFSYFRLFLSAR